MKKFSIILALVVVILASTSSAEAYGGGIGNPPANPNEPIKIVCTRITKNIPFNRTITIPRCHVERNSKYQKNNKTLNSRLTDFFTRIRKGGR